MMHKNAFNSRRGVATVHSFTPVESTSKYKTTNLQNTKILRCKKSVQFQARGRNSSQLHSNRDHFKYKTTNLQ